MTVPGYPNSSLVIWLRCKICGGSFSQLSELIQHKQQWHLAEFQRTNSHSFVFDEVIPNGSQGVDVQMERTQVDSPAQSSQFQFAQEIQVSQYSDKGFSPSSVSVTVSQPEGNTNKEEDEIAQLITFDKNFERHEVNFANQDKNDDFENVLVNNIEAQLTSTLSKPVKAECSKLQNSTDSDQSSSSHDSIANTSPQVRLKRLTLHQIEATINFTSKKNSETVHRSSESQNAVCSSSTFETNQRYSNDARSSLVQNLKSFKCVHPGCSKAFRTRYHCKRHSAIHSKYRPGLPFKKIRNVLQKSILPQSVVVVDVDKQEPARPFTCLHPQCSSSFTAKSSLKRHAVTHMDHIDRPVFVCEICKDVFWYKDNLKTHCSILHQEGRPDKPFKCTKKDCSTSYNWKNALTKHEKRHN